MIRPLLIALAIVASACGGSTTTSTEAPAEAAAQTTEAPSTTAAPDTTKAPATTAVSEEAEVPAGDVDGMAVYEANCARCHGDDGTGGRGPSLVDHVQDHGDPETDIGIVTNGGTNMPSFGEKLTGDEIVAVVDYVYEAFAAAS